MSFRVRASKFRHVFGSAAKRADSYDGIRITRNAWDSPFCSVNGRFLAIVLEVGGGGAFTVLNLEKTGRVGLNDPKVAGHTAAVLDIQFCPFNDYVIASASEDCTVKVWELPEGGLTEDLTEPVVTLERHQRRVGVVEWHPTAENILFTAGFDYMIYGWNIGTGEATVEIACHADTIYSLSFNWIGSQFVTTCKDKKIRVIDARSGQIVSETDGHKGAKASRAVFCGTMGKILTTGFSRMNERQFGIWDPENMAKPLKMEMIDTSSGTMFPYFDEDTQLAYLAGKGDGNVRYYELTAEAPYAHYINDYKSSVPQRGVCFMPKRCLNVGECEIGRAYKLTPKGFVEVLSFTVPRKSNLFQEDLFPPTKEDAAVLSAEQWLAGENAEPKRISLKDGYKPPARAALQVAEEAKQASKAKEESSDAPTSQKELLKAYHEQKEEIKLLQQQLATANIKIRQLEQAANGDS
eukprot:TRINITY_DN11984_c0_g2_i1.p1 TRINITY_DN11984_c0_g2~~TRINITY_DN11984_c0_g2_i1.p1  ORF type:complete len:473 (+),score=156.09 TRINITY_DN11984_c0_g2_i1:26-1420(+)